MTVDCDLCTLPELFEHIYAASPWPMVMLGDDATVLGTSDDIAPAVTPVAAAADAPLRKRVAAYLSVLQGRVPWLTPQEADCVRTLPNGTVVHERVVLRRTTWGASLVVMDQTELRRLQTADVQTARLAAIGFMVAGVCHEVTNPLTSLHSIVQFLRSEAQPGPDLLGKGLDNIAVNVQRLLDISRRLVNFSRVGDEPRGRFAIGDMIEEALHVVREGRMLGETTVQYRPDLQAIVFGNAGQVREIFLNLFMNAVQAMDGRGTLDVSVRRVDGRVEVSIADSGPGVPAALVDRIFEPFFTTRAHANGTGLGLAICNEIAHEHGGRIELRDNDGAGATFCLTLPGDTA